MQAARLHLLAGHGKKTIITGYVMTHVTFVLKLEHHSSMQMPLHTNPDVGRHQVRTSLFNASYK